MNSSQTFHLRLFGAPAIEANGVPMSGRVVQRHRVALLAMLALSPGQRASRDKLIGFLWPESDQEKGRNLLNVATYVLRSEMAERALLSSGDDLRLNPQLVGSDVTEFEAALARGDNATAVALYRGPFLDGFFLPDTTEFEHWLGRERDRLAVAYGKSLEALAESAEGVGNFAGAAELWRQRSVIDPYDSRVATHLMRALEASGNRAGALQHASEHQRLLQQEFGIAAAPEVATMAERMRSHVVLAPPSKDARAARGVTPALPLPTVDGNGGGSNGSPGQPVVGQPPWRARSVLAAAIGVVLVAALAWRMWPSARHPQRSIAVLPFVDLSAAGNNEFFSDGLTEEIIAGLSGVPDLKVISRTSAMHYKSSTKPLRQIGRELQVAHILEGSVRQSGRRVRITAQLIDAATDQHLWSRNYDDDLEDIFRVQEEIAREVVRALELELDESNQGALVKQVTRDPEAYTLYRRGRYLWQMRTREGHQRAAEYYRQAIARDSNFAAAYAALADNYLTAFQLNQSTIPPEETYTRLKLAVSRALALDSNSSDARTSYATLLLWDKDWLGAERQFRRAIQLNPNNSSAHTWYGLVLSAMGRGKEALETSRRAYELDPFAVVPSANYAWQCYLSRDTQCAIDQLKRTIELQPGYGRGLDRLALIYAKQGRVDEALKLMLKAISLTPERPDFIADLAFVQALRGDRAEALKSLERVKVNPFEPFHVGRAYVALGQHDSAFAWLGKANWRWSHRADRRDPALDPLRADPRWERLSLMIDREMGMR